MGIKSISKNQLNNEIGMIILAIKPKDTFQACQEIADKIDSPNIVSVVAGIKLNKIERYFKKAKVVRIMPITASAYGKGLSLIHI